MDPISWVNDSPFSLLAAADPARAVLATPSVLRRALVERLTGCKLRDSLTIPVGRSVPPPRCLSLDSMDSASPFCLDWTFGGILCPYWPDFVCRVLDVLCLSCFGELATFAPSPPSPVRLSGSGLACRRVGRIHGLASTSHRTWTTTYVDSGNRTLKTLPVNPALTWCIPKLAAIPMVEGKRRNTGTCETNLANHG